MERIFLDGIEQMQFTAGLVRISTFAYGAQAEDGKSALQEPGVCLVTTPQGFAAMLRGFEEMAAKLVEAGVLQQALPTEEK